MTRKSRSGDSNKTIAPVRYAPPGGYALDVEIISAKQLRSNAAASTLGQLERLEFHILILFTGGRCNHMVDFESIVCRPRTLLIMRPGQVHRFDMSTPWQGWLLLFRPEFLPPKIAATPVSELELMRAVEDLPTHMHVKQKEAHVLAETIQRMFDDSRMDFRPNALHALLRNELQSLLIRLHLMQARVEASHPAAPLALERFKRFRTMLESEFHRQHRVRDYAQRLGCSEKSLARSTLEVAGVSAKQLLSQRIALEAKRLLSHTSLPISGIADKLGFDEATNFVKFFRREAGTTPGEFRRRDFSAAQPSQK